MKPDERNLPLSTDRYLKRHVCSTVRSSIT